MISFFTFPPLQFIWASFYAWWPYSDRFLFATVAWLSHDLTWWTSNAFLYLCWKKSWFAEHRLQPGRTPNPALVLKTLKESVISSLVTPFAWFALGPVFYSASSSFDRSLPPLTTVAWQVAVCFLINDLLFYSAHRILHHPRIYKYVHKQHHEFITPIGISAEYAHPVEMIVANIIPTFIGPAWFKPHVLVFCLYLSVRMLETIDAHSGYAFPWSPFSLIDTAKRHDFHHRKSCDNFGMFPYLDQLFGTNRVFKRWQKKQEFAQEQGSKEHPSYDPK